MNRTFLPPRAKESGKFPLGFVTSAMAANYLDHALRELGLTDAVPVLKLGVTYPLDPALITGFAEKVERLVVVEERRGFIEEQIALILSQASITKGVPALPLYGKKFPQGLPGFPEARGLNPSIVIETLAPLLLKIGGLPVDEERIAAEVALINLTASYQIDLVPGRPPSAPAAPTAIRPPS